ncbi:hypothetical protein HPG69_005676 [Diceros bicornis minor]|uniref:G-protein coupled receptors family 1 profile domain-containing protein n=1 Tax=Diceros bicornis minor TaxID=77932 RepID=A0A7J7ES80_DICBM|nr:hypothetical protein HPG69_005676 [Diceros bicornis minor]
MKGTLTIEDVWHPLLEEGGKNEPAKAILWSLVELLGQWYQAQSKYVHLQLKGYFLQCETFPDIEKRNGPEKGFHGPVVNKCEETGYKTMKKGGVYDKFESFLEFVKKRVSQGVSDASMENSRHREAKNNGKGIQEQERRARVVTILSRMQPPASLPLPRNVHKPPKKGQMPVPGHFLLTTYYALLAAAHRRGFEHVHIWISFPLCLMYFMAIPGNYTILFVVRTEPSLHELMYYFLSMLALSNLGLSFSSLPIMLRIFLFNVMGISADACITQEFFIHEFTDMESSVLPIMSFDRFVAIRNPLI